MIKFFRKIRQKLLTENKFSKYLLYAIGEILLVVIGILIALQINNQNEFKKERIVENDYLSRIRLDLQKDTISLKNNIKKFKNYLELKSAFINSIYDIQKTHKDFIALNSSTTWDAEELTLQDNTFSEISSSGKFGIIRNIELKEALIDYYKMYNIYASHISEMNRTGLNMLTEIFHFLSKYFEGSVFNEKMYNKKDWEFINNPSSITFKRLESTAGHYIHKFNLSKFYCENLLTKADNLLKLLEKE